MTRAEFDVGAAQPAFDQDQLACVVPFDRVADELQDVADDKRDQRPRGWVAPNEKVNRQDERHRQADRMKSHVAGMQMAFAVVFEEASHCWDRGEHGSLMAVNRNAVTLGLEIEGASRDNAADFVRGKRRRLEV